MKIEINIHNDRDNSNNLDQTHEAINRLMYEIQWLRDEWAQNVCFKLKEAIEIIEEVED